MQEKIPKLEAWEKEYKRLFDKNKFSSLELTFVCNKKKDGLDFCESLINQNDIMILLRGHLDSIHRFADLFSGFCQQKNSGIKPSIIKLSNLKKDIDIGELRKCILDTPSRHKKYILLIDDRKQTTSSDYYSVSQRINRLSDYSFLIGKAEANRSYEFPCSEYIKLLINKHRIQLSKETAFYLKVGYVFDEVKDRWKMLPLKNF